MNNLPIRARLLIVALLPLVIIALLLSAHFAMNRLSELDHALRDHGQAIARQLAPACEYGVFGGNREVLARLAQSALRETDVVRVTVSDDAGAVLARAERGRHALATGPSDLLSFTAPIERSEVALEDYPEPHAESLPADTQRLGMVTVELSRSGTTARQQQMLIESLAIVLGVFAVTAVLAWRLGRAITEPVIRLTETVERIRGGDLGQRVVVGSGAELGQLEGGINAMAEGLSAAREREKRLAEDTLFQERMRAQVTLESIGDGVITTDAGGYIVYLNPVAEELTGWTQAQAEGRPLAEVFRVIDERLGHERGYPLHLCLHDGRMLRHESRHSLLRKDDRRFSVQDSAAPIRDRSGRILGAVVVFHDTTEMQHLASRMAFLATHDSLTGLLNRHEFEVRLQQALESARRDGRQHAVCYLDLDQFKIVNDTCGHVAGDELLKQLTHRLHGEMRSTDVLARLGGDEFGVILEDTDVDTAYRVADGLRQTVKDFRFVWEDRAFEIGVSIGLVPLSADSGSMTDVLSAADSACYVAKDMGRNRVHIYQPDDAALARRHGEMQWVQRINDGLGNQRFQLYGQRIAPLAADGQTICEILLRLEEPGMPLIPPSAFIPAAERYYLMPAIDRWVIARAFAVLREGDSVLAPSCRASIYAINLSGQSLCDDQFLDYVIEHLRQSGIAPERLCFEITETAAIANLTRAITFIARLKDMGCRFALDDFGSGLSSFGYLKNLPVDYLKIAGNFIQDIAVDPVDHAMVDAINQIGHVIGLQTIAESVENEAVLAKLRLLGVDYVQGYGIESPQPLRELLSGY
jgi:diguanylate cyclase (GGDEF)-like protein/PAS domain S-box-containing protein